MIRKIHTIQQLKPLENILPVSIYREAFRILTVLKDAYGETDGGFIAFCDSKEEADICLKEHNALTLLPEWENHWEDHYLSQLYLLGDDYAMVLFYPM